MSNDTTLAQRLEQANSSAAQSWIITELLLNAYPATLRQAVLAAAVPHWFTADILAALLDLPAAQAQERYAALQSLSIVQPFGDLGHTLHDLTRSGILTYLAGQAPEEVRLYSQRVQPCFTVLNSAPDTQTEVEAIYHQLISNAGEGRTTLKTLARTYRNANNFAAVENLLRNYRELIDLGLLESADEIELEQQGYWTADALANRGKSEKGGQGDQYIRKALERFALPDQLPALLADKAEKWREQIDTYKHDFVRNQLEIARNAGDLARQPFWMTQLATIYRAQGDWESALQQLDEVLTLAPGNAMAWRQRGVTHALMEQYQDALIHFSCAIDLDNKDTLAITNRGLTYHLLKRYEEALTDFTHAIDLNGKDASAFASRGETYLLMKRYEDALANFTSAIDLDDKDAWVIASRGETYRLMGNYKAALADFDRAIELNENYARALASRGETYRLMERYEAALADFDRAIELDKNYVWAIVKRADTYQALNRHEEAWADYDRATNLVPDWAWPVSGRAESSLALKHYNEALIDFTRAIELAPTWPWPRAKRGETYRLRANYEAALADFNRAIELDENFAWAIVKRADTYQALNRHEEAWADYDRATDLVPDWAWPASGRAESARALKRYGEALVDFSHAIDLDPSWPWTRAKRGEIHGLMGHYEQALEDMDYALHLDPSRNRSSRGLVLTYLGRLDEAEADYEHDLKTDPNDLNLNYHLTGIKVRLQKTDEAQGLFTKTRELLNDEKKQDDEKKLGDYYYYGLAGLAALERKVAEAFENLEKACTLSDTAVEWAYHDIAWTDFRNHPKFQELIVKPMTQRLSSVQIQ